MEQKKKRKKIIIAAVATLFSVCIVWLYITNTSISVSEITVESGRLPAEFDGFKIACISDLHNHRWGEKLTSELEAAAADIIVITGDLVDSGHPDTDAALEAVNQAVKIAPVYYVNGNHEAWLGNYGELRAKLINAGAMVLDDEAAELERKGAKLRLCGVQDTEFAERGAGGALQEAIITAKLKTLMADGCYNVVLCHRPEAFAGYVEAGADLVFAGHAHGGQVRIPFIGGLVAPNQGFFPKYTEGVYSEGETDMIVSRGLGNSILPLRVNNGPELVVATLRRGEG